MTTAYQTLSALVGRQVTGEFICVGDNVEIHVFLQAGNLAWATLSNKPMEFVQYLQRNCDMDMKLFREALAHATQTRAPVGETLVEWHLVSWADVRNAILHQMNQAMAALKSLSLSQTMFLERKHFSEYNPNLTFTLGDVVSASEPPPVQPSPAVGGANRGAVTAKQILAATPALSWVEVLVNGQSQDVAVTGTCQAQLTPALAAIALHADANFQAIRSPGGVLIGLRWDETRSVYCWLPDYAAYGQTVAILSLLRAERGIAPPVSRQTGSVGAPWTHGASDGAASEVLRFSDDLLAVVTLNAHEALGTGAGRGLLSADACLAMCSQVAAALQAELPETGCETALQAAGFQLRTVVVRYKQAWCLGTENPALAGTSIWLLLKPGAPQGLGWACLSAVLRDGQLLDALVASAHP